MNPCEAQSAAKLCLLCDQVDGLLVGAVVMLLLVIATEAVWQRKARRSMSTK